MSYSATILADSPIAYYRMADPAATLADSSGHGRDGSLTGTYTRGVTGLISGDADAATAFGGGYGGATLPVIGAGDFTIEGWFLTSDVTASGIMVCYDTSGFWMGLYAGNPSHFLANDNAAGQIASTTVLKNNTRYHWAVRRTGTVLTLFLDGMLEATGASTESILDSVAFASLSHTGAVFQYTGTLDEIAFFDVALSDARIAAHYAAGAGGSGGGATSYLAAPDLSTLGVGEVLNVTVTPDGRYTGTITGTPSGAASTGLSPVTLTFSASATPQTASWTPTATGTLTITWTNSGGLVNPAADAITVTAAPITVTMDSTAIFLSPYNWTRSGSAYIQTSNTGAYLKTQFSGTSCKLLVTVPATAVPEIAWSIDGGILRRRALTEADTRVILATGLAPGVHTLRVAVVALSYIVDRWITPVSSIRLAGLTIDAGAALSVPTVYPKNMLLYADSNGEGVAITGPTGFNNDDASLAYPWPLARALGCEVGVVSFASQGYNAAAPAPGNVPALTAAWDFHHSGVSRLAGGLLTPPPDYIVCAMGENDGPGVSAAVTGLIAAWRAAAPGAALLFCADPPNAHPEVATAVAASGDARAYFVPTGENMLSSEYTEFALNVHFSARGHARYAAVLAAGIRAALDGGSTGTALSAAGVDAVMIEPGINLRQAVSLMLAALAGKASGLDAGAPVYNGAGTSTPRISAATDGNGNRSSVTLTPPA